jgi:hypothetical protein
VAHLLAPQLAVPHGEWTKRLQFLAISGDQFPDDAWSIEHVWIRIGAKRASATKSCVLIIKTRANRRDIATVEFFMSPCFLCASQFEETIRMDSHTVAFPLFIQSLSLLTFYGL